MPHIAFQFITEEEDIIGENKMGKEFVMGKVRVR